VGVETGAVRECIAAPQQCISSTGRLLGCVAQIAMVGALANLTSRTMSATT